MVLHALVLLGLLPSDIVWGGRFKNPGEVWDLELLALLLNSLFFVFILFRMGIWTAPFSPRWMRWITRILAAYFALNTLGNLFSESDLERLVFSLLSAILSLCLMLSLWADRNQLKQK